MDKSLVKVARQKGKNITVYFLDGDSLEGQVIMEDDKMFVMQLGIKYHLIYFSSVKYFEVDDEKFFRDVSQEIERNKKSNATQRAMNKE